MPTYIKKPEPFEAYQWNGESVDKMPEWVRKYFKKDLKLVLAHKSYCSIMGYHLDFREETVNNSDLLLKEYIVSSNYYDGDFKFTTQYCAKGDYICFYESDNGCYIKFERRNWFEENCERVVTQWV